MKLTHATLARVRGSALVAISAIAVGCGGASSSESTTPQNDPPPTQVVASSDPGGSTTNTATDPGIVPGNYSSQDAPVDCGRG